MSKRDLIRKLLEEGDDYEGDIDVDYSQSSLRKMRDGREKLGIGKPKREKPEWKKSDERDDD